MPRLTSPRLLLTAAVLALGGQPARADPIRWDYATFVLPGFVAAVGGDPAPPSPFPWIWPGNIGVSFQGTTGVMAGSSPITFANWWVSGWLPFGQEGTFQHQPLHLGIAILDRASDRSEVALFTGYLDGPVSFLQSDLSLTYSEPSKTLHIGSTTYRIDLSALTPGGPFGPGPLVASGPIYPWPGGFIAATVQVHSNPEPSTLVLLGLGGSAAGLFWHRRRRRQDASAAA